MQSQDLITKLFFAKSQPEQTVIYPATVTLDVWGQLSQEDLEIPSVIVDDTYFLSFDFDDDHNEALSDGEETVGGAHLPPPPPRLEGDQQAIPPAPETKHGPTLLSHVEEGQITNILCVVFQIDGPRPVRTRYGTREVCNLIVANTTKPIFAISLWESQLKWLQSISASDVIYMTDVRITKWQKQLSATATRSTQIYFCQSLRNGNKSLAGEGGTSKCAVEADTNSTTLSRSRTKSVPKSIWDVVAEDKSCEKWKWVNESVERLSDWAVESLPIVLDIMESKRSQSQKPSSHFVEEQCPYQKLENISQLQFCSSGLYELQGHVKSITFHTAKSGGPPAKLRKEDNFEMWETKNIFDFVFVGCANCEKMAFEDSRGIVKCSNGCALSETKIGWLFRRAQVELADSSGSCTLDLPTSSLIEHFFNLLPGQIGTMVSDSTTSGFLEILKKVFEKSIFYTFCVSVATVLDENDVPLHSKISVVRVQQNFVSAF